MKPPDGSDWQTPSAIRFRCTDCGRCCTGGPGAVRITDEEITTLAAHLGEPRDQVRAHFIRPFPHHLQTGVPTNTGEPPRWSLTEKDDHSCTFYTDGRCSIYPARPAQCRTYPFWLKNLRNEEAWKQTARNCPGIGHGPLHTSEQILDLLEQSPM